MNRTVEKVARHLHIFELVLEEQPIGIAELSNITEQPHHQVRYSLRQLENENLIEPTSKGAVSTDEAKGFIESHDEQINEVSAKLESIQGNDEISAPN